MSYSENPLDACRYEKYTWFFMMGNQLVTTRWWFLIPDGKNL